MNEQVLEKLEKNGNQQLRFTKILCVLCAIVVVCMLVMTVFMGVAVGKIFKVLDEAELVISNLDSLTWELANSDLGAMMENMDKLAAGSQTIVEQTLLKLDALNFDVLNQAIEDLAAAVEALTKFPTFF